MSANPPDRLSDAFSLLATDAAADMPLDPDLEERLMTEAAAHGRNPRTRMIMAVLACVIAGITATTVVASGGVDAVRVWFATVTLIHEDVTMDSFEVTPESPLILEDDRGVVRIVGDEPGEEIRILTGPIDIPDDAQYTEEGILFRDGDDEVFLVPVPVEGETGKE